MYWMIFSVLIITLLILDLGFFNKKDEVISLKNSILLSLFYLTIALLFGVYVYYSIGSNEASEYFTGFILEKTMSLDNIFVISIIFNFFKIPAKYQHRVLFWGILGVIILRAVMILAGATIIANFQWVLFIFSAFLIFTGIKTLSISDHNSFDINDLFIYKFIKRKFSITKKLYGNKFFIIRNNKLFATPLFAALVTIEFMDVIFAIDSIPAIFAITQNTFIVYTSNIFAILGLRALFFCLADIVKRFHYLKYSLAIILIFIGIKIFITHFIIIPPYMVLSITILIILAGIIASLFFNKKLPK